MVRPATAISTNRNGSRALDIFSALSPASLPRAEEPERIQADPVYGPHDIGGRASVDQGAAHGQLVLEDFNVAAFVPNAIGTFGNSGKNILRGPRFFDTDLGLLKDFGIVERMKLQFRAEFFNAFNNVNLSFSTGQITSTANGPRVLQFALKLTF